MPSNADEDAGDRVNSKVARLIEQYGLGERFGDQLEARWTADGDQRESLRALADRFNKRLLDAALHDADVSSVDGEVDNLYRLLTSDDVSSGNRTEAQQRLEQNGVDIDQLERDFVTYQAVRSYLTAYRGAEYDRGDDDETRVDNVIETIQRLTSRTRSVAEKSIDQLDSTDRLSIGEYRLFIDISVLCEDCDTQYGLIELLREGSCECQSG
ncbi:rod-determining factor RdfA [Haloarchaeobius litoreus]|uniref:Rod-determining factor RdfA n=1 Tax=Haloarchaeobius litoreus TaxID=755306 RepID=A0ABD6DLB8_9EURY|nr:rod-determining factor RdfA [Haloarchaeobius litoreus]